MVGAIAVAKNEMVWLACPVDSSALVLCGWLGVAAACCVCCGQISQLARLVVVVVPAIRRVTVVAATHHPPSWRPALSPTASLAQAGHRVPCQGAATSVAGPPPLPRVCAVHKFTVVG